MENRECLGQHKWLLTVESILRYCGMEEIWLNPNTIKNGSLAPKCSVILRNKFVDYWSSLLHDQHSRIERLRIESQQENAFVGYSFTLKYMI